MTTPRLPHQAEEAQQLADDYSRLPPQPKKEKWALESKAYGELLVADQRHDPRVLFSSRLLLPFSYCIERWCCLRDGQKAHHQDDNHLVASFTFGGHSSAFRFTLRADRAARFVNLALAVTVSFLVVASSTPCSQERKQDVNRPCTKTRKKGEHRWCAPWTGDRQHRRRPQRGFLTGATIVLVTFTLLSFHLAGLSHTSKLKVPTGKPVYKA
jgi:hypothetical protein